MKTFITVMCILYVLRALHFAVCLGNEKYPIIESISPSYDVMRLLFSIGFAGWAAYLLFL